MTIKGTPQGKRAAVGRLVTAFSISEVTLVAIDRVCRRTGEARGRLVDAVFTHPKACACSICEEMGRRE